MYRIASSIAVWALAGTLRVAAVADVNCATYHCDNLRTGWNSHETVLSPATVRSSTFGVLTKIRLDGRVYAQPLYASHELVSDARIGKSTYHNLVIIATEHDSVYAFDADTGETEWTRSFLGVGISPLPGTIALTNDPSTRCINPEIGITSTPVINLANNAIYVAAGTMEGQVPHYRLHAISLLDGVDILRPADIVGTLRQADGTDLKFDPTFELNRPGLLFSNGSVYVAFGSICDRNPPGKQLGHGWLFGFDAQTMHSRVLAWNSQLNNEQRFPRYSGWANGSIWQSGFGLAADGDGNLYFATGNGDWDGVTNFGDSVIKFAPDLPAPTDYFTPAGWSGESFDDLDLGSGGVMLLPDEPTTPNHLAVAGGKAGITYLLNRDSLGHKLPGGTDVGLAFPGPGALSAILTGTSGQDALLGGPAYFTDSTGRPNIVVASHSSDADQISSAARPAGWLMLLGVSALQTKTPRLIVRNQRLIGPVDGGTIPVVSSNSRVAGSAVIWLITRPGNTAVTPLHLQAYEAVNLRLLKDIALPGLWNDESPYSGIPFLTPTVVDGRVFVASNRTLTILGIRGKAIRQ